MNILGDIRQEHNQAEEPLSPEPHPPDTTKLGINDTGELQQDMEMVDGDGVV